jgi:iron complex transport system substrate-binding protein
VLLRGLLIALAFPLALSASPPAPARIVSTAPSVTEILYALGLGPKVAGVTSYCRYPAEAASKPKVGTFLQPDYERVLALRPDLVLVIRNPAGVTARMRQLGLRAEELDQDSIAAALASIVRIGELTGHRPAGDRLAGRLKAELEEVRRRAREAGPPRSVLFLAGRASGTLQGMVGVGPGAFIDELLSIAGGTNVLARSPLQYPKVTLEAVLTLDPEVILDMGDYAHAEGRPGQSPARVLALWRKYPQLRAVRSNRVRVVGDDALVRPGPRMGQAARAMFKLIHPEPGAGEPR